MTKDIIKKAEKMYIGMEPIWDELDLHNVNYANIKGEALSLQAYGKYGMRNYNDIDILINRNDIKLLEEILKNNGFTTHQTTKYNKILYLSASHQTPSWRKVLNDDFSLFVDVNFDIFWGEYTGDRINIEHFLSDVSKTEIFGYNIKTLPLTKVFVQLVLHHYKEMNSIYHLATHDCIKKSMFCDIYNLIKNHKNELTIETICKISKAYNIVPYVFYILHYTNLIYHDTMIFECVERLKTDEGIFLLDKYGLAKSEQKVWSVDFKTRLESENLFLLVEKQLSEKDFKKLQDNLDLFE